jgi:5,10-methylenetetrahydromethanopterin reductase
MMSEKPELPSLGVRLHGGLDPKSCVALARGAEAHGYASVWFAENPSDRGIFPAVSACVVATSHIRIGVGIVNPYTRHPTLIAMEFGALDELAEGRALLGIGSGIGAQIERLGYRYRPLAAMEDAVHIVRALLGGEHVSYRGRVFSADNFALRFRPPRPLMPIYMAAMGERSLALCGRIADGLIVSNMCPPAYTQHAVEIVETAAEHSGRPRHEIVQYVPCVARPDRDEARRSAKAAVGGMLTTFWPVGDDWPPLRDTIVRYSGIAKPDVIDAIDRLRRGEPAAAVLDDRFIDAFAIAGTADDCGAAAARYHRAGVDELVLTFAGGQPAADMAYLGAALGNGRAATSG